MAHLLAIDQSTSATKAILFDSLGKLVDKVSIEHRPTYPQPGFVEHDPEEIWRNTLGAIKTLADRAHDRVREVPCLSITCQRETFVVFDRATGKPLHPAIVWQCRRGEEVCAELRRAQSPTGHFKKNGLENRHLFQCPQARLADPPPSGNRRDAFQRRGARRDD